MIRKSITSLRKHIEKVTDRLPVYHDEDEMMSQGSGPQSPALQHKDTTLESMVGHEVRVCPSLCMVYLPFNSKLMFETEESMDGSVGVWQYPLIYFLARLKVYCENFQGNQIINE